MLFCFDTVLNPSDYTTISPCQDPSGSIGAGIHVDVLQTEEGVSPGAVLMLEQVFRSLL